MVRNIIKNSNTYLAALAMCAAIASCTSDEDIVKEEGKVSSTSTCDVKEKQSTDEFSSRSMLNFGTKGMEFVWEKNDEMTVMARNDNSARQIYVLQSEGGEPKATFYTENFKPKIGQLYYAFGKSETSSKKVKIPDQNNITVDYSGQTQIGNASPRHLGEYDFLASAALCENQDAMHLDFNHLGSTFRVVMDFDVTEAVVNNQYERAALTATADQSAAENAVKMTRFTEMEIYDSENTFRQTTRNFSFATGTNGDNYTFAWPGQEITKMDRFKVALMNETESRSDPATYEGAKGITRFEALVDKSTNTKDQNKLIAYMEFPPADFTNKKIVIMLKGYYEKYESGSWKKHDVSYVATHEDDFKFSGVGTRNLQAGKACVMRLIMKKPEKFDISLKVNHMWQHGSTLDQTLSSKAGTGDPGYDKEIVTPTHIYYIYCHDGEVVAPRDGGTAVTSITGLTSANWDTKNTDGVWVSTYKDIITFDKPHCDNASHNCEYHLYVAASTSPLTFTKIVDEVEVPLVNIGSSEADVVRALTYNLPDANVQTFMRDLYSTPWDATSFVGDITDPVQDVILYHVAAKVDLKWNSATAVERVYADNVKNNNLLLFQPTQNLDGVLSSGGYSDSWTMPVDQQYNGRYILYLPQFKTADNNNCSYKIGLGAHATTPITFTPISTQGGFTSWLRWLKKK